MRKRAFGAVRKLPSGRFQAHYTNRNGLRELAPQTFAHRADAEAWLGNKRRELDRNLWNPAPEAPEQITFGVYADSWLANRQCGGRPLKTRTREHYAAILADHLLPTFGDRVIRGITPKDVRTWYASTLLGRPTMRSHAYALLKTIMASAVADELADAQPCRIVGAATAKRASTTTPATPAELTMLAEGMPERLRLMVMLGSWCALRFGELVELRRKDIDLGTDAIRVRRAVTRTANGYEVGDPKSDAGRRDVDIPPHVIDQIVAHLERFVGAEPDALLFPAESGGHLAPATLYRHWHKARAAAGRPDLRFHDLRHSGAVIAALSGATLSELQDRLGHSTAQAALRYQHVAKGRGRELAVLMSKLADG